MIQVKDLIREATVRFGLPRKQSIPGDMEENAFKHLKGIVNKYNKENLLNWTQNSVILPKANFIHIYDEWDSLKGDNNLYFDTVTQLNQYPLTAEDKDNDVLALVKETPNLIYKIVEVPSTIGDVASYELAWDSETIPEIPSKRIQDMKLYQSMFHFQVQDVAKINSIYVISGTNESYREYAELTFRNHTDYDRYPQGSPIFTYTEKAEGEWLIQIKPFIATGRRLKVNYNEAIDFDINSTLYIPDNYVELLIVALAHKLAIQYPRLDEAQMARLEKEVLVMVNNVRTPKAVDRMLTRKPYFSESGTMTQYELMAGNWI